MSLFKIAWRSIQQRALASSLTAFSMSLGVALVVAVLVIYGVVRSSFNEAAHGYDMIVGAKGGKLQLVLNTVFHLSQPIENIPWNYYKDFKPGGRFASRVELAIPYCLGDNYKGYRVVGTSPEMFSKLEYAPDTPYRFSAGENFKAENYFDAVIGSVVARKTGLKVGDYFAPTHGISTSEEEGHTHDDFRVVGILAPTGTPNDRALFVNIEGFFLLDGHAKPVEKETAAANKQHHGDDDSHAAHQHAHDDHDHAHDGHEHGDHDHAHADGDGASAGDSPLTPGPSPARGEGSEGHPHDEHDHAHDDHEHAHHHEHAHDDHDHAHAHDDHGDHHHDHGDHAHGHGGHHHHHHHEPLPEEQREVTAILVKTAGLGGLSLPRTINKEPYAQSVSPVYEIRMLFDGLLGNLRLLLFGLAVLVVVVSGIGIMVSIYNSMNDRRNDIAVMRALGASRGTVMAIILLESILLAVGGGLFGVLLGHGLIVALNPILVSQTGVSIGFLQFEGIELVLIPALVVLAAVVGYLPAVVAYRTDVAQALSERP